MIGFNTCNNISFNVLVLIGDDKADCTCTFPSRLK